MLEMLTHSQKIKEEKKISIETIEVISLGLNYTLILSCTACPLRYFLYPK